ncbi:PREDICTED: tripartite motif-containing protein 2-like [Branchiostoma belcheri]|uniref:RING-type E3 ubiquitin transferase n=1 Tax=Branchiostoma belcheri TaxID=7741 RepID=A0A6P5ANM5_BRABE|nr:PREDICTED: tripartite motif-containing protein 2-like [Branchiostoma belcheri]
MAAASPSLGEQIREELSCSVCLELFTRPKVLPCGHTFCQDCLQKLSGKEGTFQCPTCRLQVKLPSKGVAGLADSCIVANMCERLQNQARLTEGVREQPQSRNRCSLHPFEDIKVYCKECQIPVCEQCLEEAHDDHRTTTIKKAAQERRSTVQALINEGRKILENYCRFLTDLREKEKALNEQKQQTDNNIIQTYNTFLSEVEQNHTKNLDRIQKDRTRVLADVNELSAACDRAEQDMEQGKVGFLSQELILETVVEKYRDNPEPTPFQTQPAVFQPTDTLVSLLGHVTVQSFPSAPIPAASSNGAAEGTGHHHGNSGQGENQYQRVTFGGRGDGTEMFDNPSGVTVSKEGEIFVADSGNQRIKVLNLQRACYGQSPKFESNGQYINPDNLAMNGKENLWVVGRTKYDASFTGHLNAKWSYNMVWLSYNMFELQKTGWIRGVAMDIKRNHVLITQTTGDWPKRNGEVQVFQLNGKLVMVVGQQQGMKYPQYITVDGEGNILVSDYDNHCIYVYNQDGEFLFKFGGEGSGEGQLKHPRGICTDKAGNIIVADRGNSRVEMFDKTGKFLKHITMDVEEPKAVAVAAQGQVVVTDDSNHTVSIFTPKTVSAPVVTSGDFLG